MTRMKHLQQRAHHMWFCVLALVLALPTTALAQLDNPLRFPTIQGFIEGLLQAVVIIATPIITLAVVYSGFLFITARGNEEQLRNAKRNFLYVLIGALLILGAWALAQLIGGTINELRA